MACFDFIKEAKKRITIQEDTGSTDSYGGSAVSWGPITDGTVWSVIKPVSDFHRFQSQQLQTRVTHKFIIRFKSSLKDLKTTVKHRISFDSRLYDIRSIMNVDDNLKNYGTAYQIISADEAGPDV